MNNQDNKMNQDVNVPVQDAAPVTETSNTQHRTAPIVNDVANSLNITPEQLRELTKNYFNEMLTTPEGMQQLQKKSIEMINREKDRFNMYDGVEKMLSEDSETSTEEKQLILDIIREQYDDIANDLTLSDIKRKEYITNLANKELGKYKTGKKDAIFNAEKNYHEFKGRVMEDHKPIMGASLCEKAEQMFEEMFPNTGVEKLGREIFKYLPPKVSTKIINSMAQRYFEDRYQVAKLEMEHEEKVAAAKRLLRMTDYNKTYNK
jgi:hypothetical protein